MPPPSWILVRVALASRYPEFPIPVHYFIGSYVQFQSRSLCRHTSQAAKAAIPTTAANGLCFSAAAAFKVGFDPAAPVLEACVHVKQNVPEDVAPPVPCGPGSTAEVTPPTSVVTVGAVES